MRKKLKKPAKLTGSISVDNQEKIFAYLYILITYLLCLGSSIFTPVDKGYKMLLNETGKIGLKTPLAALFFTACFIALFILQHKLTDTIGKKKALLFLVFAAAVYFISMPFFSSDVFLYSFKGKIQAELALNPYEPIKYFDTPYIYLSPWIFVPLAYGTAANFIFKITYIESLSPFLNMYILKLVFLAFFAGLTWLAYRVCSEKNFVFFVLSPFVLIETILCAHLDIMPLLFFALSLYFIKKEKFIFSALCLGVAVAFKLNYAIFMPLFFIESARKNRWFIFDVLYFIFPVVLSLAFFPGVEKYLDALKYVGSLRSISVIDLFAWFKPGKYIFVLLLGLVFVYFFYYYLKKRIDIFRLCYVFFLLFLFFDRIFQPWHILPLYAIMLFLKKKGFDYAGLISLIGVYSVYFIFYEWNPLQNSIAAVIILLGISFAIALEAIDIKRNSPFYS